MSIQEQLLLDAARDGRVDEVRNLLDEGTDPSTTDRSEFTPLHHAAKGGTVSLVELLLGYGADPNVKENSGSASLHYAARDGHNEIIQLLLEYWADPNSKDNSGLTPLHIAAKGKNVSMVKLLLDAGADKEVQDNDGNTTLHIATELEIAQLLLGEPTIVAQQAKEVPLFPITINGNTLEPSMINAGPLETKYILVQSWARLNSSDRQDLGKANVSHLDYISKNTYLCQYHGGDLEKIRQLKPVVYVVKYPKDLKITHSLKEVKEAEPDRKYTVDVIFHESVDPKSIDLQRYSGGEVQFLPNKARLSIRGFHLDSVASIDDVRRIEDVGEVVKYNNIAREILKINSQSLTGLTHQQAYQGGGQVIAVADTGLDRGQNQPLHHAFENRVRGWIAVNKSTKDSDGHGTHVCGSAVSNDDLFMGTAPKAELIVQSIWDIATRNLKPPASLTDLFHDTYHEMARVHSNSWGTQYKRHDKSGKEIPFRQVDYTAGAIEIDKFVYEYRDMIICFAAGNDGEEKVPRISDQGNIGGEAAAKNCITVGASRSKDDSDNPNPDAVADFSSRGPVKRNQVSNKPYRYKPDLVAPGTCILSAKSSNIQQNSNTSCCRMSGTSMATPLVAGCAAVLREALDSVSCTSRTKTPTAALIKALLINGADILKHPWRPNERFRPQNDSGFGRVNMASTFTIVHGEPGTGFREYVLSEGTKWDEDIEVKPEYNALKVTLVWSDPPGEEIKNQLLLEVNASGKGSQRGIVNNTVQQVVWHGIPHGVVTLKVRIVGTLDESPQPFAVVWRFRA